MSIEKKIDQLIAALDRNTEAMIALAGKEIAAATDREIAAAGGQVVEDPAPIQPKPPVQTAKTKVVEEAKKEPELTIDQVREALKNYAALEGKPAALELLKTKGLADSISEVKPANYKALFDACNPPAAKP